MEGAVDLHVHAAPSIFPRSRDDHRVAEEAAGAGMAGLVLKAHEGSTAERARLASGDVRVWGGVVLNRFVGGLNPAAVEVALALGARVVWMPTIHAAHHLAHYGGPGFAGRSSEIGGRPVRGVSVLDEGGRLLPEAHAVLEVVADHSETILCNGHLSMEETAALFVEARRRGIERLLLAHPDLEVSESPVSFQEEMVRLGAYVERTYLPHLPGWGDVPIERTVSRIRTVGVGRTVVASDLGQADTPLPTDGLADFCGALREAGLSETEVRAGTAGNPAELLGMD